MLTFRTPPSKDHLFSVLTIRIKHIPDLATTTAHLKRISYGRMDRPSPGEAVETPGRYRRNSIQFFRNGTADSGPRLRRRGLFSVVR